MTLQIFLHFFHHKFVTSHSSTSLPPAASALSLRRIGDALLLQRRSLTALTSSPIAVVAEPDRALRTSSPIAVVAEPDRALRTSSPIAVVRNPTARAVTLSVNPRQRRGHTHRCRCAADAPPLRLYSGTALRCISSSPLYPRTRCPGKSRI